MFSSSINNRNEKNTFFWDGIIHQDSFPKVKDLVDNVAADSTFLNRKHARFTLLIILAAKPAWLYACAAVWRLIKGANNLKDSNQQTAIQGISNTDVCHMD